MSTIIIPEQLNLDKICRTCLNEGNTLPLYEDCKEDTCIIEMLMSCTLVQFSENDGLPKQICKNCIEEIKRAFSFAKLCEESDEVVRKYLAHLKKQEKEKEALEVGECEGDSEYVEFLVDDNEIVFAKIVEGAEQRVEYLIDENHATDKKFVWKTESASDNNIIVTLGDDLPDEATVDKDDQKIHKKLGGIRRKSSPPYECKKCNQTFPRFYLLKEHRLLHTKKDYGKRQCQICSKYISYSHFRHHLRTHTAEKPYCCEFCGKRFVISSNLVRHRRTHSGERPYKCDICGKAFTQSTRLKDHVRIHSGEKPFVCNVCGKAFGQTANFKSHLKRHEKQGLEENELKKADPGDLKVRLNLTCEICSQVYSSVGALKTHMVTHGEKNFCCNICGRGFISMVRLKKHLKSHDDVKPFQCLICQKTFTMKTSLKNHMLIHTGEKNYPCKICCKAFTQIGQLTYHMRTHSGVRPYTCHFCGKTFALNGNLTVHMRQHTGETPYYCPVCNKGYYDSSSMKKHLRGHSTDSKS